MLPLIALALGITQIWIKRWRKVNNIQSPWLDLVQIIIFIAGVILAIVYFAPLLGI
jgi:hypothetical protein